MTPPAKFAAVTAAAMFGHQRSERPRRGAPDQRYKEQRHHRQPEGKPKTVNVSEHVGLPLHPRRKRAGPRRRGGGAMAGKTIRQSLDHARDIDAAVLSFTATHKKLP